MSLALDAVTVCVNYSEYLKLTAGNKAVFDRWMIVTVEQDKETIKVCEDYGLEYCFTKRLYEGGPFCKGKAINDALLQMQPKGWVCHVDADTYLFAKTLRKLIEDTRLDSDNLYGLYGRLLVKDGLELEQVLQKERVSADELEHTHLLVGFFQMWHSSMRSLYPERSKHAGMDDLLMRDSYDQSRHVFLPAYAIHIGELWINHKGVSHECDGSARDFPKV